MKALVASGEFELAGVDAEGQQQYRLTAKGQAAVDAMPTMKQTPIAITGVWLRTAGGESGPRYIEVLVEFRGKWRLVNREPTDHHGEISHITEPLGIRMRPLDYLYEPAGVEKPQ